MPRISRRARDADGRTIEPMTLGNMREVGVDRVLLSCVAVQCGWSGSHGVSQWPDDFPVPDVGARIPCPKCGAREVDSRPDWPQRKTETRYPSF